MSSQQRPLAIPAGRISNSAGSRSAGLPCRASRGRRPARRGARGLVDQRGRRRQPQPRVHRQGGRGRHRRQAGAALCAARRRELALPLSRSHYEYLALTIRRGWRPGWCRRATPQRGARPRRHGVDRASYHHAQGADRRRALSGFVGDIATFLARTLFFSSDLAIPAAEKKEGIAAFAGNHALCKITEDLIFTDPYRVAEQNRWTQPWLDATAAAFREDLELHARSRGSSSSS